MGASFSFSAEGVARFRALAGALDFEDASSPESAAVLKEAARIDAANNTLNFNTSGQASGPAWEENGPAYKAFKQRALPGRGPLRVTDRLRGSLTKNQHPERIKTMSKGLVTLGTRVPYAAKHLEGFVSPGFRVEIGRYRYSGRPGTIVPARDFLQRDPWMTGRLVKMTGDVIVRQANAAWRRATGGSDASMRRLGMDRILQVASESARTAVHDRRAAEFPHRPMRRIL